MINWQDYLTVILSFGAVLMKTHPLSGASFVVYTSQDQASLAYYSNDALVRVSTKQIKQLFYLWQDYLAVIFKIKVASV
ncbi:hypothetical protein DCC35_20030 [Mangrovivirga cuniculi]|uniref:Uncharacterized protein n=1 Tax=Mangrovivirga cuniculi TaxID=2715131 RepID=A0A4D7KBM4_9BACT|nr:hypothetical protein DCC35_20030 [Mangrovivirga cuniculi]